MERHHLPAHRDSPPLPTPAHFVPGGFAAFNKTPFPTTLWFYKIAISELFINNQISASNLL